MAPNLPAEVLKTGEPPAVSGPTACPPGVDPGLPVLLISTHQKEWAI